MCVCDFSCSCCLATTRHKALRSPRADSRTSALWLTGMPLGHRRVQLHSAGWPCAARRAMSRSSALQLQRSLSTCTLCSRPQRRSNPYPQRGSASSAWSGPAHTDSDRAGTGCAASSVLIGSCRAPIQSVHMIARLCKATLHQLDPTHTMRCHADDTAVQ